LYDKDGNEITEHKRPYENEKMFSLETPTEKGTKSTVMVRKIE
jgi:hypothetical protein